VTERLNRLRTAGGGDIVRELFKPLPSMVVAHYLGVPLQDRDRFDGWTDAIVAANATAAYTDVGGAIAELMGYFGELSERRRREPADDTVSHLVAAGEAGDDAGILRILAFTFTMVTGGNDTSTGMLGGGVQLLSERRDQRRLALDDIDSTVEELLRLTSPVQGLARSTTREVTIDGVSIPEGRKVLMCYGAANRDQEMYGPDADELDVTRNPRQILTFSHGAHHCLGAAAARMMGRVTLTELLQRIPDFRVDLDAVRWADGPYVRRPLTVPMEVL
jgi:cytochrome P450